MSLLPTYTYGFIFIYLCETFVQIYTVHICVLRYSHRQEADYLHPVWATVWLERRPDSDKWRLSEQLRRDDWTGSERQWWRLQLDVEARATVLTGQRLLSVRHQCLVQTRISS